MCRTMEGRHEDDEVPVVGHDDRPDLWRVRRWGWCSSLRSRPSGWWHVPTRSWTSSSGHMKCSPTTRSPRAASGAGRRSISTSVGCVITLEPEGDKSGLVGPPLKDVVERLTTDEAAVATKIKSGGPRMPAFRHNFTDADIADLMAYLKSPTCCYETQDPPKNPHYNADTTAVVRAHDVEGRSSRPRPRWQADVPLEGIKVQLIAPNAVRTTVFTDAEGRYEFPAMQAGSYTLRIRDAAPLQGVRARGRGDQRREHAGRHRARSRSRAPGRRRILQGRASRPHPR